MTNLPFDLNLREKAKMVPNKRQFVLKPREGGARTEGGALDPRLFTGDVNLYAVLDSNTGFWFLKYDRGDIPGGLQQKWTQYSLLVDHVKQYFNTRNVDVEEVQ